MRMTFGMEAPKGTDLDQAMSQLWPEWAAKEPPLPSKHDPNPFCAPGHRRPVDNVAPLAKRTRSLRGSEKQHHFTLRCSLTRVPLATRDRAP